MNQNLTREQSIHSPELLERQLVRPDLTEFVATLAAVRGHRTAEVGDIIGPKMDQVLSHGLRVLDSSEIRAMIDHPGTLLMLQDRIFVSGGEYWDTIQSGETENTQPVSVADPKRSLGLRGIWLLNALAALLLLAVGVSLLQPDRSNLHDERIAFAQPDRLDGLTTSGWSVPLSAGMVTLRSGEEETESEQEFAARVSACMEACMLIYRHELTSVPSANRDDLREKCLRWMKQFGDLSTDSSELAKRSGELDNLLVRIARGIREIEHSNTQVKG